MMMTVDCLPDRNCGGLMRNVPYRFKYLNTSFPVDGAVWKVKALWTQSLAGGSRSLEMGFEGF